MHDLIIIGAGPAGISAGIYAKRIGMNVLLLDFMPGGLLNKISIIDNYPGFESITGPQLCEKMINHMTKENVPYKIERVLNITKTEDNNYEITTNKNKYTSKLIIIAIGRKQRKSGIKGEEKFFGKGISYCAICDAPLYKNKKLAVIGGGNSALEESLYLSKYSNDITIYARGKISADDILVDKVKEKNIKIIENTIVDEFYGEDTLQGIIINGQKINCDGAFIYVGYEADTFFLKNLDIFDENGYVIVDNKMKTKENGVFACGDIIKKDVYQICTAVSEGAIAAISAHKELKNKEK